MSNILTTKSLKYIHVPDEIKELRKTNFKAYRSYLNHRNYEKHREERLELQTKEKCKRRIEKYIQQFDVELIKEIINNIATEQMKKTEM
jgi:hypothetical protein